MTDIIATIISHITSSNVQRILLPARIVFWAVGAFFFGFLVFFLLKTKWLKLLITNDLIEFFTLKMRGAKKIAKTWAKIQRKVREGREANYKWAIIKADDLLGMVLERLVLIYQARNFEERLNYLNKATFPNIEQLRQAHEIRKKIEQEPDFSLSPEDAKEILRAYEDAFREIEIIR